MVYCVRCGKKIGLLQPRFAIYNEKGNALTHCPDCNNELLRIDAENKRQLFEKQAQELEKQAQEERQKLERQTQEIIEICKKYLSNKDFEFKGVIEGIYNEKDLFAFINLDNLDGLREYFIKRYRQIQEKSPSNSEEYDKSMGLEALCNFALEYIEDLINIKKVLQKKNISTHYKKIIKLMVDLIDEERKKERQKITIPAYKVISKITTTDKKKIIQEYLKLGLEYPSETLVEDLFDKFNLPYSHEEVINLLHQCIEEVEINNFEKNLGVSLKKKIGAYEHLDGSQFEEYLKDLFSILGYQVIRTKHSHDQGADLILKKEDDKIVVQAKKYMGDVTNKAIQEVVASKEHYRANKAMVVTTGNFTKSAIELAKSNKVDLWDEDKLKKVIEDINRSSPSRGRFHSSQSVSPIKDKFPVTCPFCKSGFQLSYEDLPSKNEEKKMVCPECNFPLSFKIDEKYYICAGCKEEFVTLKERIEHSELCLKYKERKYECKICDKSFILDDHEFQELKSKGTITFQCPSCKESNTVTPHLTLV